MLASKSSHRQTGEASRQPVFCGYDDSNPRARVQLTINYPDTLRRFLFSHHCPNLRVKVGFMKFLVG